MFIKLFPAPLAALLAVSASAEPYPAPYALTAVHADFETQLVGVAAMPGAVGQAARVAADLMGPHNAEQERLALPLLAWAEAETAGQGAGLSRQAHAFEASLPQLYDSDVRLVTALVELYAAADEAGEVAVARLAERMIWHETSDVEVLYPSALLVGETGS